MVALVALAVVLLVVLVVHHHRLWEVGRRILDGLWSFFFFSLCSSCSVRIRSSIFASKLAIIGSYAFSPVWLIYCSVTSLRISVRFVFCPDRTRKFARSLLLPLLTVVSPSRNKF